MLYLQPILKSNSILQSLMKKHYSNPKGFVGRNIHYAIYWDDICYGCISGGSATLYLPGRNEYFNVDKHNLNGIVNNIFYHIEKFDGTYPCRWFTQKVIAEFRKIVAEDWEKRYGDKVIGFETLVELPRTGECYRKDGWTQIGQTKGFTCRRIGGTYEHEKFGGVRVWNYTDLKPKLVFAKKV